MSVERIQLLHEDYIRLTERFKALWTFHQFLRGVYKTFFSSEPGYSLDFNSLYEEVRAIAAQINTGSPEAVEPQIRDLWTRLDAVTNQLRDVDRKVSPSFVRRFFEKEVDAAKIDPFRMPTRSAGRPFWSRSISLASRETPSSKAAVSMSVRPSFISAPCDKPKPVRARR